MLYSQANFLEPEIMFNKYFGNHDVTHKLLLGKPKNMFNNSI